MKIVLCLVMSLLFTCKGDDNLKKENEIEQFLNRYYQTMSDRNWQEFRSFFWDDATLCTIWSSDAEMEAEVDIFTIQDFISKTSEGPDSQPVFEEKMEKSEITIKGNLATAWVNYSAKFGTTDDLMEWTGTDLFSLMQYKNEWKIVNLSYAAE